jgi:hypothetical protein
MSDPTATDPFQSGPTFSVTDQAPPSLPDLPPVEAPSAGFIVQLFLIPAVVVAVVIVVWLLFGKLAHGEHDAMEYVRQLRSPSASWRMAYELASLIRNDPKLANDPLLLGEMCDLLSYELDHPEDARLTEFVTHAVGAFESPEGRLTNGQAMNPLGPLARALGPKSPGEVRIAAAMSLAKYASRLQGKVDDEGAVKALAEASADQNSDLRQIAVYALGFFGGDHASKILRERIETDPDRFPRYNAAIALARRSDPAATATLREMLTTSLLDQALSAVPEISSTTEKQNKIESIQLEALQGLQTSIDAGSAEPARSLRPEVTNLTKSGLVSVRNSAQAVLQKLPETR